MKKVKVVIENQNEKESKALPDSAYCNGNGGIDFNALIPEACVTFRSNGTDMVNTSTIYDHVTKIYAASALSIQDKVGPEYENIVENKNNIPKNVIDDYVNNRRNSVKYLVEGKLKDIVRSAIYKARYNIINDLLEGGADKEQLEKLFGSIPYDVDIIIRSTCYYNSRNSVGSLIQYDMAGAAANNKLNQISTTFNDICNNIIPHIIMREYDDMQRIITNSIRYIRGSALYNAVSEKYTTYLLAAQDEIMYNTWNLLNTAIIADAASFPSIQLKRRRDYYDDEY